MLSRTPINVQCKKKIQLKNYFQSTFTLLISVRWFGTVEGFELVGLESIGITLTGKENVVETST